MTCEDAPPEVPTHKEYTLADYDGAVRVTNMSYPSLQRTELTANSSLPATGLPRNYMANLTYTCGWARLFQTEGGPVEEMSMTCQWDKTWSPGPDLDQCDWVACLKPPSPPAFTNLRVTDWDGLPIKFGDDVHFVCSRGTQFEEDPAQEEVTYSCQDGSAPGTSKGFFDVPEKEDDWPRCLQGRYRGQ